MQYYKRNRLKQLRAFCQVVRSKSISQAAHQMCLSQSAVSLQVKALEDELGKAFFDRHGPRIKLTAEGRSLYKIALPLIEGIDNIQQTLDADISEVINGDLDIIAGESTMLYVLPGLVEIFSQRNPNVHLRLLNLTGKKRVKKIRNDEADCILGSMNDIPDDVDFIPLLDYTTFLITPREHQLKLLSQNNKITLKDIVQYPLIAPPQHLSTWNMTKDALRKKQLQYQVTIEASNWEIVKKYVATGLGISIVSSICLTGEDRLFSYNLSDHIAPTTYGICTRKGRLLSSQTKSFIELATEYYRTVEQGKNI